MAENQKEKLMRVLKISAEDAEQLMTYDKAIDKNEKDLPFDLTDEQQKAVKKYITAGTRAVPTVYNFDTKDRKTHKENPTKASIIAELAKFLEEISENATENVTITNVERQITFKIGENVFELTLVQKRTPKK